MIPAPVSAHPRRKDLGWGPRVEFTVTQDADPSDASLDYVSPPLVLCIEIRFPDV
jgi:hypothetical protein